MDAEFKLMKARTNLIINEGFFGVLAMHLEWKEDRNTETCWTDGTFLGYNPEFIDKCDLHQVEGILCEAVSHVAFGHPWRRENRDEKIWNDACDYAIHPILVEKKFRVHNPLVNQAYDNKSPEWIYKQIFKPGKNKQQQGGQQGEQQQQGGGGSNNSQPQSPQKQNSKQQPQKQPDDNDGVGRQGGCGVKDCKGGDKNQKEQEWQRRVIQAGKSTSQGDLPAGFKLMIDELTKPKVDWRQTLRRFLRQAAQTDFTWHRPSKKWLPHEIYMPSVKSQDAMPEIVIAVDTSGSVMNMVGEFGAEVRSIIEEVLPEKAYVVYIDAAIHSIDVFERGEGFKIDAKGGGGTAFEPVFEWVAGKRKRASNKSPLPEPPENLAAMVYLTDLYGSFPSKPPEYPVLWACINDKIAPFGETVKIESHPDEERG